MANKSMLLKYLYTIPLFLPLSLSPSLSPSFIPHLLCPTPQNKSYPEFSYSCESYSVGGGTFLAGVGLAITGIAVAGASVAKCGVAVVGFTPDGRLRLNIGCDSTDNELVKSIRGRSGSL